MRTLLLVDDERNILSSLKRLLRHEGYEILTAPSGADALALMAGREVGVVVCDGLMQEMTGAEFLLRVRNAYPDSVRIMLSGYTDPQVVDEAMRNCDLFKFLTKPWDDQDMVDALREAFRLHEATLARRQ
jgi:DNA-binding NtrC family response regulator